MELRSIISSLENKTIFITGATGFLAKIFIEKVLRVQPNIKKLYALLRAENAESAEKRLRDEVVDKDLFKLLREKHGNNLFSFVSEKVTALAGDLSAEDLGLNDSLSRDQICSEIDAIINFAATTKFDDRYDAALSANTFGALHVLNFAKQCPQLKILVHVSTAYVSGEDEGVLLEKPFLMGEVKKGSNKIDINTERKIMQQTLNKFISEGFSEKAIKSAMKDSGIERARKHGWPNTYVFTKAMGEMIMTHLKESVPVVIVRPTMIIGTFKDPFPGWIEDLRTLDCFIAEYGRGRIASFVFNPKSISDVIPADMVVNAIIVCMVAHRNQHSEPTIYHLGSSLRNPLNNSDICDIAFRYFHKHPWINKDGNPVSIDKFQVWESMTSFNIYINVCYRLPLKVMNLLSAVTNQISKDKLTALSKKIERVTRFLELYEPYLFFNGVFDDRSTKRLQENTILEFADAKAFCFDSKTLNWEDYMMNAHIPGLVKYCIEN